MSSKKVSTPADATPRANADAIYGETPRCDRKRQRFVAREGAPRPAGPLSGAGGSRRREVGRRAVAVRGAGLSSLPRVRDAPPRPAEGPGRRRGSRRPRAVPCLAAAAPRVPGVAFVRAPIDLLERSDCVPREPLRARGTLRRRGDATCA